MKMAYDIQKPEPQDLKTLRLLLLTLSIFPFGVGGGGVIYMSALVLSTFIPGLCEALLMPLFASAGLFSILGFVCAMDLTWRENSLILGKTLAYAKWFASRRA